MERATSSRLAVDAAMKPRARSVSSAASDDPFRRDGRPGGDDLESTELKVRVRQLKYSDYVGNTNIFAD